MFNDLIHSHEYHGLPLSPDHTPFIEPRLADALATIEGIMSTNRYITAVRVDLRIPNPTGLHFGWGADASAIEFVKKMQHYARWKHTDLHKGQRQKHRPVIDAIWQMARTPNGNPCYKVMLLLNHAAYHEQSIGFDPANTLQYRASQAWSKVNQIPKHQAGAYIRFPAYGLMTVENTADGLCQLFAKASVLCVMPNDAHGQAFLSFGSTRQAHRSRAAI